MKHRSVVVGLLAVWFGGCGDNLGVTGEDAAAIDASAIDAAAIDAAAIDAPIIDAPAIDAPTTITVSVTVHFNGPVAGARVMFMTANDAIASETTTDAAGFATGIVPAGGSLLVWDGLWRTSYVGVEDGDHLRIGVPIMVPTSLTPIGVTVPEIPPDPFHTTVTGRCVYGSSSGTFTSFTMFVRDACGFGPRDLLAVVQQNDGGRFYLPAPATVIDPDGFVVLEGAWQPPATFTASFGGVPAQYVATVQVDHHPTSGPERIAHESHFLPSAVGGATSGTLPHPPPIGDGTLVNYRMADVDRGMNSVRRYHAARVTTLDVPDVGADLLPPVTNLARTGGVISWSIGAGRPHDGVLVQFQGDPLGSGNEWRIVLPAGTTSVAIPAMPGWGPFASLRVDVTLIESGVAPGRELRETMFATARDPFAGPPPHTVRESSLTRTML